MDAILIIPTTATTAQNIGKSQRPAERNRIAAVADVEIIPMAINTTLRKKARKLHLLRQKRNYWPNNRFLPVSSPIMLNYYIYLTDEYAEITISSEWLFKSVA
jgi:hypothetical protein